MLYVSKVLRPCCGCMKEVKKVKKTRRSFVSLPAMLSVMLPAMCSAMLLTSNALAANQAQQSSSVSYSRAQIYNSTQLYMFSTINYDACGGERAYIDPFTQWISPDERGLCLLQSIETKGSTDGSQYDIDVTPYQSSDTSFSHFALIVEKGQYETVRYNLNYESHTLKAQAQAKLNTLNFVNSTKYKANIKVSFFDTCPDITLQLAAWGSDNNVKGCVPKDITGTLEGDKGSQKIKLPYRHSGGEALNFVILNDKNNDSRIVDFVYGSSARKVQNN